MVKVDKGDWDKSRGPELNHEFNLEWLRRCQRVLKPNGTIWVSGTLHVIFSIGYAMQQLGFKILNDITWEKPNPPPNLSCRYFTHSTAVSDGMAGTMSTPEGVRMIAASSRWGSPSGARCTVNPVGHTGRPPNRWRNRKCW
jgi:hypothetical protein